MKRKTILTLSAVVAAVTLGVVAIPAVADGKFGPSMMMSGHSGPAMMMRHGGFGGCGPDRVKGMTEHPIYQSFDTDADGMVSPKEATDGITELHQKFDANSDGALSADEFKALFAEATGHFAQRPFAVLDADDDGKISAEEMTFLAQMMGRMQKMHSPTGQ